MQEYFNNLLYLFQYKELEHTADLWPEGRNSEFDSPSGKVVYFLQCSLLDVNVRYLKLCYLT